MQNSDAEIGARAAMWAATEQRMATGSWPAEGRVQARERRNEALALADAVRTVLGS